MNSASPMENLDPTFGLSSLGEPEDLELAASLVPKDTVPIATPEIAATELPPPAAPLLVLPSPPPPPPQAEINKAEEAKARRESVFGRAIGKANEVRNM